MNWKENVSKYAFCLGPVGPTNKKTVRIRIRVKQSNPGPYQIEKQDPDLNKREKKDPDPHQKGLDPQHWT
jgi:hypothetical protein